PGDEGSSGCGSGNERQHVGARGDAEEPEHSARTRSEDCGAGERIPGVRDGGLGTVSGAGNDCRGDAGDAGGFAGSEGRDGAGDGEADLRADRSGAVPGESVERKDGICDCGSGDSTRIESNPGERADVIDSAQ